MRQQQDIQVALRERYRRLLLTEYQNYGHEARLIAQWMAGQPPIKYLMDEAFVSSQTQISLDDWLGSTMRGRWSWPTDSEAGRASLIWQLMQSLDGTESQVRDLAFSFSGASNTNEAARDFTEQVLSPLFDFLTERIGAESSILYHLERYVRRVEWFDRAALHAAYEADRARGEDVYDRDLRKFLFDQGLSMPFSQTKSASGLSDVLGALETDDPLLCEVKLFDGVNHGKREIAKGVNQVVQYANDYGKKSGYLVIVNLSGRPTNLPTDAPEKSWPPYIEIAGVRVYLMQLRALPVPSASKQGKPSPIEVVRDELCDPDA